MAHPTRPDELINKKPQPETEPVDPEEVDEEVDEEAEPAKKDPLLSVKDSSGKIITSEDVENGLKKAGGQIVEAMSEPFQEAVTEVVGTAKAAAEAFLNGFTNRKRDPDLRTTKEGEESKADD